MKRLVIILLVLSVLVGAAACSAAHETVATTSYVPGPSDGSRGSSGMQSPPITYTATTTMAPTTTMTNPSFNADTSAPTERMVVRTANLQLVVSDVATAVSRITGLASDFGGFVVSSNTWQDNNRTLGNISFRVKAESFDQAIAALHNLADNVRSESTSGQDVTEEYVDLTSRLTNLQAAEAQLLKLMEQAGSVADILSVQQELVQTRGEIEQTKGRMQYLEQTSAMSLIQVDLEQSKLTVDFNADGRNIKGGQAVQFTPTVSGGFSPYSYQWDFGDGATSLEQAPSHAYKKNGNFTVSLKVTDDRSNTASYERKDYITVLPGWNAGSVAGTAWNGMVGFFRALADIIIWLGIFIPVWIIILGILYFAWWRRRKKA